LKSVILQGLACIRSGYKVQGVGGAPNVHRREGGVNFLVQDILKCNVLEILFSLFNKKFRDI
jgi:hypothetical protein